MRRGKNNSSTSEVNIIKAWGAEKINSDRQEECRHWRKTDISKASAIMRSGGRACCFQPSESKTKDDAKNQRYKQSFLRFRRDPGQNNLSTWSCSIQILRQRHDKVSRTTLKEHTIALFSTHETRKSRLVVVYCHSMVRQPSKPAGPSKFLSATDGTLASRPRSTG